MYRNPDPHPILCSFSRKPDAKREPKKDAAATVLPLCRRLGKSSRYPRFAGPTSIRLPAPIPRSQDQDLSLRDNRTADATAVSELDGVGPGGSAASPDHGTLLPTDRPESRKERRVWTLHIR